jgi:hypothetical protein
MKWLRCAIIFLQTNVAQIIKGVSDLPLNLMYLLFTQTICRKTEFVFRKAFKSGLNEFLKTA